jgi:hypothetical protein
MPEDVHHRDLMEYHAITEALRRIETRLRP